MNANKLDPRRRPNATLRPSRRRYRNRFRASWLLVPLACALALWFLASIDPVLEWADVLDFLRVRNRERYSKIALCGLALIGVLCIYRIVRPRDPEQ